MSERESEREKETEKERERKKESGQKRKRKTIFRLLIKVRSVPRNRLHDA